ncbi:hypothetical protein O59_000561 [Cellvibrio sp. BR]|nr:hypothetical protein O59_000561 [Cellvibrio sp. BR]
MNSKVFLALWKLGAIIRRFFELSILFHGMGFLPDAFQKYPSHCCNYYLIYCGFIST